MPQYYSSGIVFGFSLQQLQTDIFTINVLNYLLLDVWTKPTASESCRPNSTAATTCLHLSTPINQMYSTPANIYTSKKRIDFQGPHTQIDSPIQRSKLVLSSLIVYLCIPIITTALGSLLLSLSLHFFFLREELEIVEKFLRKLARQ